jgi:hypothetical protein
MRRLLLALVLLAAACQNGHPPSPAHASVNAAAAAPATAPAPLAVNAVQPPAPQNRAADPAIADLSRAQRRAYELGYRDCSQGRYAPADHLEAYRIGCAAAHAH